MRSRNSGRLEQRPKTNLFDDPERDEPAGLDDDEITLDLALEESGDEAWYEEPFNDECSRCCGLGVVTIDDELDESECPRCYGTGALVRSV